MLGELTRDLKFACRSVAHHLESGLIAVFTFGVAIAACTAMFSVVDAVLFKPLSIPEPERIVNVYPTNPRFQNTPGFEPFAERGSFSYPELEILWRESGGVLDALAMSYSSTATLRSEGGSPERVMVRETTAALPGPILGLKPLRGRLFTAEDATSDPDVVLLSESFWRLRYATDPEIVGKRLTLGERARTVIGVVSEGPRLGRTAPDFWALLRPWTNEGDHRTSAIGRLAAGVTTEQATERLGAIFEAATDHDHSINVFSRHAETVREVRAPLLVLAGAALLLLVVGCANVAALLVGRMLDRERELVIRNALGAGRWRVVRLIVTECLVLAGAGALLGIALCGLALRGLGLIAPPGVPRLDEVALDGRVLAFSVLLALVAGVSAGLVPGLAALRSGKAAGLGAARNVQRGRARLQAGVVLAEIAVATVLLVSAGLLVRTVIALGDADVGFAVTELVNFDVSLPASAFEESAEDGSASRDVHADIARELETLPGVASVALTTVPPLTGYRGNNSLAIEGYLGEDPIIAERRLVSAGFFETAGIRLVEGRGFSDRDDRIDSPGTMVVSESLARLAWPDEPALGKRVTYWGDRETRVVGVAVDQRDEELRETTPLAFYVPRIQAGQSRGSFLVRGADPASLLPAIRNRVREIEPSAVVVGLEPMENLVREELAGELFRARLAFLLAGLATLFSILGIFGVTARAVAARTREFGVRKALGATDGLVMGQVLRGAVALGGVGALLGLGLALAVTRLVESMLWGVEPTDATTLVTVAAVLAGGCVVAALLPGARVRRLNPVEALRAE